ncbi:MAG: ABC transporter permease [Rhodanobacteraceae bacterium]|nr:MAG: ABC transporter permease [Rhodanobacteraceae bacterium]
MTDMLNAVWRYRHFILTSIKNDLRTRFARSRLGATWMILQALFQGAIYALVLGRVLGSKLPNTSNTYAYVIYLLAGLLGWTLFAELVNRCLTIFVDNASLLKKMVFPRICLPLIVSGSCLLNNVFLLVATIAIFVLVGNEPAWMWLWLLMLTGITVLFGLALGLILGILNVFIRDIAQVMNVIMQLWFWLTPIVYPISTLQGHHFAVLLRLNPMYAICSSYQQVLLWGQPPHFKTLAAIFVLSLVLLAIGMSLFRRAAPDMVDVL